MADILIVEDNEELGMLLSDFLTAEGYDVYHALSGEEALEILAEEPAKLVILDIIFRGWMVLRYATKYGTRIMCLF